MSMNIVYIILLNIYFSKRSNHNGVMVIYWPVCRSHIRDFLGRTASLPGKEQIATGNPCPEDIPAHRV